MYKRLLVGLIGVCFFTLAIAQQNTGVTGKWYGISRSWYGEKQRLLIILKKENNYYTGKMISPDQSDVSVNFDHVVYRQDTLLLRRDDINFSYTGVWDAAAAQFKGWFTWDGQQNELVLSRKVVSKETLSKRPQEPKPPYPYFTEEVKFYNKKDSLLLAGTFTCPDTLGKYPVVVMISGSGPQDRNNELAGHKTFLVLADYLARNGIASLRYDDRGAGASTGAFENADIYNLAEDAKAAVNMLKRRKEVRTGSIGVLGHSEGAAIAMIVAANNPAIAFVISMAGIGIPGREFVDQQLISNGKLAGEPDSIIQERIKRFKPYWDAFIEPGTFEEAKAKAYAALKKIYHTSPDIVKQNITAADFENSIIISPESVSILQFKPLTYLRVIKCPFMAINGSKDMQVDATVNLNAIERSLHENGNMFTTIRKFDGLNHLFQRCKTCAVSEYGELEQTLDPLVSAFIAHWILQLPPSAR